MSNLFLLTCS